MAGEGGEERSKEGQQEEVRREDLEEYEMEEPEERGQRKEEEFEEMAYYKRRGTKPKVKRAPRGPTKREREEHEATHCPYAA
eukprot:9696797-Karenia_brevis.AAC.1